MEKGKNMRPWRKQGFLIGESDYRVKMTKVVEPFMDKYKKEGDFRSFDGMRIHYHYIINPQEKAAIVISHGFTEFVTKFYEMMYYYYQIGYSVFFIEHRGHGYSGRVPKNKSKVYVDNFHEYVADMNQFVERIVKKKSTSQKLYLFGHSMGGAISTMYLEKYPKVFEKAVLSSPMLEMKYGDFSMTMVKAMVHATKLLRLAQRYVPGQRDFSGEYEFAASCLQSKERYNYMLKKQKENEHYQTSGSTFGWASAGYYAAEYMRKNANKVKIPVLLCQAGRDDLVQAEAQEYFANASWRTHVSRFPSAKHEIYNSTTKVRKSYYNIVFSFLEA